MTDCNLALPIGFRKSAVGEHRKLLIRLFLELGLDRLIMKYLDTDICLEQRICPRSGNLRAELSSGLGKPKGKFHSTLSTRLFSSFTPYNSSVTDTMDVLRTRERLLLIHLQEIWNPFRSLLSEPKFPRGHNNTTVIKQTPSCALIFRALPVLEGATLTPQLVSPSCVVSIYCNLV